MGDFFDQARILAVMYELSHRSDPTKPPISYSVLKSNEYFVFMDRAKILRPMLTYLQRTGYIAGNDSHLELTGKGWNTTISLYQKFLDFINRYYHDELSYWIRTLGHFKSDNRKLIRESYFHITHELQLENAFNHYLSEIVTIENVDTFKIDVHDLNGLIDNIFQNLDDINRLFEFKFECRLFSLPMMAPTTLYNAVKGKEINLTELVATIGSIIDCIHHKEIDSLLSSSTKINGSINKIQSLLDKKNINYDLHTFEILRALHHLRNIFPIHETGPEIIRHLQKLNIDFPFEDKDAATKMLQSLNSCLLDMKSWLK